MTKQIKVNGQTKQVLNSLSSGPGCTAHTYEFKGGYVFQVGRDWLLQEPGQFARTVTVERA